MIENEPDFTIFEPLYEMLKAQNRPEQDIEEIKRLLSLQRVCTTVNTA